MFWILNTYVHADVVRYWESLVRIEVTSRMNYAPRTGDQASLSAIYICPFVQ